jgi:hypothetical protein
LREMRVSTFMWGAEPLTIGIDQTRGRIRVGVAPQIPTAGNTTSTAHLIRINTQQLSAILSEGSYAIEVTADASQVSARDGSAKVTAQDHSVTIGRSQRTVARRGEPPLPPLPAVQDIIVNGDFQDPLPRGWDPLRNSTTTSGVVLGSAKVIAFDNRQTLHIVRANVGQTSADTGLIQQINREVSDYRSIRLMADVRLQNQSLSGGGILSSEYPLILRMRYRDVYGSEAEWVHGFYIQNITNNPTNNGELVPQGVWVPYESTNLFEIEPRPFFITSLQIYASGWDYDSYVTGVRLVVE